MCGLFVNVVEWIGNVVVDMDWDGFVCVCGDSFFLDFCVVDNVIFCFYGVDVDLVMNVFLCLFLWG